MIVENDRQLRIDRVLSEAHLEDDRDGGIRWRSSNPDTSQSPGYAKNWFDVWIGENRLHAHWTSHGGAGLGLAVAELFVKQHGGHIEPECPVRADVVSGSRYPGK